MYIGEAQYGKVRWVLNCGKPQRVDTPKPLPTVKTKKVRFNVNIGLTTIDVMRKGYPISGAYNLTLSKDSNAPMGAYLGVSWDMSFKKGLGIEFGDIGFAYYHSSTTKYITLGFDSLHDSWTWGDGVLDEYYYGYITATSVNLYASPIKIQYRYETPSSFAVFAVTGPAIDYLVDYSVKIQIIENGDHLILSNIFNPICFYWDIKGGVAYRFIKLTAGTSLRMNNVSKDSDYTAKIGRPFYLMFSFVF